MKKILIIMPSMFIGGAERSLLGLLNSFDFNKYKVYLFLFRHEGEFMELIPKDILLLPENKKYTTFDRPIIEILKSNLFVYGLMRIYSKMALHIKSKINKEEKSVWKSMQYTSYYLSKLLPKIEGEYDIALSFQGVPFYMKNVNAKTKMAWIHTDYKILNPDRTLDRKAFDLVDAVITVSDECKNSFDNTYPDIIEKSIVIENILSEIFINHQSVLENVSFENESINLLSIGRFCDAKNFDNVPNICKRILDLGLNVKWYLIGYGGDEQLIKDKIKEESMEDHVIILGKKENPYPYIKACDFYIQPSRYEGKAVTVREAQILKKTVIITRFPTSASQLVDGYDGVIVDMDNEGCAKGIVDVINNKELVDKIVSNLHKEDYSNASEVEKIYKLMED